MNRAYYAAFYAALAALAEVDEHPKTHAGVVTRFRYHFGPRAGHAPSLAETLAFAFNARQRADYEAFVETDEAAARDLLEDVQRFVHTVEERLTP